MATASGSQGKDAPERVRELIQPSQTCKGSFLTNTGLPQFRVRRPLLVILRFVEPAGHGNGYHLSANTIPEALSYNLNYAFD